MELSLSLATVLARVAGDELAIPLDLVLAAGSVIVTVYFWMIRMRSERAGVKLYQTSKWACNIRSDHRDKEKLRIWWDGDVYLANISSLPTAIVGAEVALFRDGQWVKGEYGWREDDNLPFNLAPHHVSKKVAAAFFSFPKEGTDEDAVREANQRIRLTYLTVDGKRYTKEIHTAEEIGSIPK